MRGEGEPFPVEPGEDPDDQQHVDQTDLGGEKNDTPNESEETNEAVASEETVAVVSNLPTSEGARVFRGEVTEQEPTVPSVTSSIVLFAVPQALQVRNLIILLGN